MVMGDMEMSTDLLVIGSGPAGYSAAIRGAELGLDVIMVDETACPGGAWLQQTCIPLHILIHLVEQLENSKLAGEKGINFGEVKIDLGAIRNWKKQVIDNIGSTLKTTLERLGILFIQARARFINSTTICLEGADLSRILCKHTIIASGSYQSAPTVVIPGTSGLIMDPAMALALADIPKQLLVVCEDHHGVELGSIYAGLGSRVSLVTAAESLLPGVDPDLAEPVELRLSELCEKIITDTQIAGATEDGTTVSVAFSQGSAGSPASYDRLIVAGKRRANTRGLGLENTAVGLDHRGFLECNDRQQTADNHIFAAGDVAGKVMQAHQAAREGRVAAEVAAGRNSCIDVRSLPTVIYTDPQISWCGLTENEAKRINIPYAIKRFPWRYSARALITGQRAGLTKLLIDPASDRILGGGIVGRSAGELIGEVALAMEMGALAEDLALTLHPIPTLSATLAHAAEIQEKTMQYLEKEGKAMA